MTATQSQSGRRALLRPRTIAAAASLVLVAGVVGAVVAQGAARQARPRFPVSPQVESTTGVRVVRATLAADGGLLDVRYIVLNAPNAQRWFADTSKPPVLHDSRNGAVIDRVAPMRDAHQQRPGQTYYLIYQNARNVIHRGDLIDLTVAGVTLHDIPVE
jgi:hypothetical protein